MPAFPCERLDTPVRRSMMSNAVDHTLLSLSDLIN